MKILLSLIIITGCSLSQLKDLENPNTSLKSIRGVNQARVFAVVSSATGCTGYNFKERGRAPIGYMKGVALLYAKHFCTPNAVTAAMKEPIAAVNQDALALYKKKSLRDLFTLLISSGMWESSGRYFCGRDMSANFSSENGAEAGLFQTSWHVQAAHKVVPPLLPYYESHSDECMLDVFKEGVRSPDAGNLRNWGDPESAGYRYQKLSKSCPAFHTEVTLVAMRKLVRHWGPLRSLKAEFVPACDQMLAEVEKTCP